MLHVKPDEVEQFDFGGLLITDFTAGTSLSASLAQIEVPPGAVHAKAKSTKCDKYYFCTAGSVVFTCEGQQVQLVASSLLVIPANEWFEYRNETSETARLLLVHVPPFDLDTEVFACPEVS